MSAIRITHVAVRANAGATVSDALDAAIRLAVDKWQIVRLEHNGNHYTINPDDFKTQIEDEVQ